MIDASDPARVDTWCRRVDQLTAEGVDDFTAVVLADQELDGVGAE